MSLSAIQKELKDTVDKILSGNKGILACDESPGTMAKRFGDAIENSIENRHGLRKTLFEAPKLNSLIGGVILHDETIRSAETTKPLRDSGIVLGIKTDKGLVDLKGGNPGEQTTQGLDGLLERNKEYYKLGARFAKWRNVLKIIDGKSPSEDAFESCASVLTHYAVLSQEASIVPIIEPEVMQDGGHGIEKSLEVTKKIIKLTLDQCAANNLYMPGALLKVNMVTKGADSEGKHDQDQVAKSTIEALVHGIGSHKIGGVVFLSGGLSEQDSAEFLNRINVVKKEKNVLKDCPLHFSFARALQKTSISLFVNKKPAGEVQKALVHRCKMCSLATKSEYKVGLEGEYSSQAGASNFVKNNNY